MLSDRQKSLVAEHFFKVFRSYHKPDESRQFTERWLQVLDSYARLPGFVRFEPRVPVLRFLKPRAHSVLVIPIDKRPLIHLGLDVSLFPFYAYRIELRHANACFRAGLEFLILYLELTGIRKLGFYRLWRLQDTVIPELQQRFPDLDIYGSASYDNFAAR